jgi:hypothetical protein
MTLCPRGRRSMSYAVRPRSGAWLASAGTRRRQGNTPPAEVHLRYICALTSRYVGQVGPSRAARGAVATGDGGCGQPSACVINLSGRKPVGVATTPRIRPVREVLRPHTDRMRAVRIRTVRSPGTSRPRGRRRPLSRRGHRWRIVSLVGSPLTATRRPLLRTPVTPSTGVDVCSPGDYVGITGHLPSALRAAAVRAAVRCSGAQRDRCRPGLGWPPAGPAPADGHSARPG